MGAASAAALAAAGRWCPLRKPGTAAARVLDDDASAIVAAIVPAMLASAVAR